MIFKPSSLHKLFFTYICPRFYGGAPAAPSNTTSTQTVNQSPWQNPVYQALMLGTADKPGPATSMLNASREQMAQWNAINKTGLTPTAQASLGTWNPAVSAGTSTIVDKVNQQTGKYDPTVNPALYQKDATGQYVPTAPAAPVPGAAQGGLMGLRGYASGGELQKAAKAAWGRELTASELANWSAYQSSAPYDYVLSRMQGYPEGVQYATTQAATKKANQPSAAEIKKFVANNMGDPKLIASKAKEFGLSNQDLADATGYTLDEVANFIGGTTGKAPYGLMDTMKKVAYFDPVTGKSTLPDFLDIQKTARNLKTPEQFAAATDMYGKSTAGLEAAAGYKPTDVNASKADVANAASQGYGATNAASQGYGATNATSEGYDAANMVAPKDISAQKADVATMRGAADVNATPLTQYQMQGPSAINAATAGTAQMQGPQSWLDRGTSAAYMDPYVQNVVNQEKEQANRDYQQQLNQLNAQSVQAGAFGGSRQAIQQSEAARNQLFNLANIEAKGLEGAYTQGAQQFNTAQGQGLQAGQANLGASQQSTLANQAAQMQAMMTNQGMDYNTAFQNLQAKLGVQNTASAQDLQAAMSNQNIQQQTQSTNMAAQNVANNAYVQNALDAAKVNYGGQLTAAQANQVAQNAAAQFKANAVNLTNQFNATNQNQASQFGASATNTANLSNQQAANAASQFGASAQNTANLSNQQAANTASNAYTQQQLAANQANQQAGLQANQQGIGALQGVASNASGLTSTGSAANAANLANLGAQGQVTQAEQNLGQSYLDAQSTNAQNWLNAPTSINAGVVNTLGGQNVQGGTAQTTSSNMPAKSWARGGLIKNGKVSNRGKK